MHQDGDDVDGFVFFQRLLPSQMHQDRPYSLFFADSALISLVPLVQLSPETCRDRGWQHLSHTHRRGHIIRRHRRRRRWLWRRRHRWPRRSTCSELLDGISLIEPRMRGNSPRNTQSLATGLFSISSDGPRRSGGPHIPLHGAIPECHGSL